MDRARRITCMDSPSDGLRVPRSSRRMRNMSARPTPSAAANGAGPSACDVDELSAMLVGDVQSVIARLAEDPSALARLVEEHR
ncbi:MAG: hypothetical protein ACK5Y0_19190, partial [Pseudomonadota bacterium]